MATRPAWSWKDVKPARKRAAKPIREATAAKGGAAAGCSAAAPRPASQCYLRDDVHGDKAIMVKVAPHRFVNLVACKVLDLAFDARDVRAFKRELKTARAEAKRAEAA